MINTAVSTQRLSRRGLFRRLAGSRTPEAVRPPGAGTEARFLADCTGCGACVDACPEGILAMSGGYPEVQFSHGGCDFCGACADVCRPGALSGAAVFGHRVTIGSGCLSAAGVVCRICAEQCETGAIRIRPAVGGRAAPELDAAACTGCGACIGPCPAGAVAVTFDIDTAREDATHAHGTL